jgi:tetratricopeptide (TPR) repeat protein
MALSPPPDPGPQPEPQFYKMGSEPFERFCLDLAVAETDDVDNAELYEPRGAKQYGADFYIDCGRSGLIIGSCKAHERPGKKAILDEAVGEFTKYWETYWKPQGIVKFIICLAGDARSMTRKRHIDEAKKRIRALGIECEVWAKRELIERCAPVPEVVRRSLGAVWLPYLCELLRPYANDPSLSLFESQATLIEAQRSAQTPLLNTQLDSLEALLKRGDAASAAMKAKEIQQTAALWMVMDGHQKAQILRTQAVPLIPSDVEGAAALYDEAATHHPPADRYFTAIISLHRAGRDAALEILDVPRTSRERGLKAALDLEGGETDQALDLIGLLADDDSEFSELSRLKAIALMIKGRADEAIAVVEKARTADPESRALRFVAAAAVYASSLSPAVGGPSLNWPEPLPSALVKTIAIARDRRNRALNLFDELDRDAPQSELRRPLQVWKVACLVDNPDGRDAATAIIDAAASGNLFHPGLVFWGLARKLPFDRSMARKALAKDVKAGVPESVSAMLALYADERKLKQGRELLEEHKEELKTINERAPEMWAREFAPRRGGKKAKTALPAGDEGDRSNEKLETTLGDERLPPWQRFDAASILADRQQWPPVWAASRFLLEEIDTAEAFRLAAFAAANACEASEALTFLERHLTQYYDDPPPWDLARLNIDLTRASGDLPTAIETAERTFIDPARPEFILRAELEAQAGNVRAAGRYIAMAAAAENPGLASSHHKIHWANILRTEDPSTAAKLLRSARDSGLTGIAGPAVTLAFEIMPDEAGPYMAAVDAEARAEAGASVRMLTEDEMVKLWRDQVQRQDEINNHYEAGDLFSHVVYSDRLGLAFLAPFEGPDIRWRPQPHIAHAENGGPRDGPFEKVLLDVTAILVADALNLWPALTKAPFEIILPADWAATLLAMEHVTAVNQPNRHAAGQEVLRCIESGAILRVKQRPAGSIAIITNSEGGPAAVTAARLIEDLTDVQLRTEKDVRPDHTVYHLNEATAIELGLADALRSLSAQVALTIDDESYDLLAGEVEKVAIGARVSDRLKRLREYLNSELLVRRIFAAPLPRDDHTELDRPTSTVESTFWSVLHNPPENGLVAWIDDRYINGHSQINNTPIIGIQTILSRLLADKILTHDDAANHLRSLREKGFRHLLASPVDIVEAYAGARKGRADTDPNVIAMEKAAAQFACGLKAVLDKAPGSAIVEHQAALSIFLAASRVIRLLLAGEDIDDAPFKARPLDDEETANLACLAAEQFRADWRDGVFGADSENHARALFVTWHASLLSSCQELQLLLEDAGRQRVRIALDAIYGSIIQPACEADPTLLADIQERLAVALASGISAAEDEHHDFVHMLTGRFIDAMPTDLREGVFDYAPLRDLYGVKPSVTIGDDSYAVDVFWNALEQLTEGADEVCVVAAGGDEHQFTLDDSGVVVTPRDGMRTRIAFAVPGILAPNAKTRLSAFEAFLESAAFTPAEKTDALQQFEKCATVCARDELVQRLAQETIPGKLWSLSRVKGGDQISLDDLAPPSGHNVSEWLGFAEDCSADAAFDHIINLFGHEVACRRWAGVPRSFPKSAVDWFRDLSTVDATAVTTRLTAESHNPIAARNYFSLVCARNDMSDAKSLLYNQIISVDLADYQTQIDLARGILQLMLARKTREVSEAALLSGAWAWADALRAVMEKAGAHAKGISNWLAGVSKTGRRGLVDLVRLEDALSPMKTAPEQLVASVFDVLGADTIAALGDQDKTALRTALSMEQAGAAPTVSLLAMELEENLHQSWLSGSRAWIAPLFNIDNDFIGRALTEPEALRREVLAAAAPEAMALAAVGVAQLSEDEMSTIIRKIRQGTDRASLTDLALYASLIGRLRPTSSAIRSARRQTFLRIARRKMELDAAHGDDPQGVLMIVECAVTSIFHEVTDWPAPVERILRDFAVVFISRYGRKLAELTTLIGESAPIEERALFFRLRAKIIAAT